eukprot:7022864-Prymnesium_polylepis.1
MRPLRRSRGGRRVARNPRQPVPFVSVPAEPVEVPAGVPNDVQRNDSINRPTVVNRSENNHFTTSREAVRKQTHSQLAGFIRPRSHLAT